MGSKIVLGAFFLIEFVVVINLISYISSVFFNENPPYFELFSLVVFGILVALLSRSLMKLTDQAWINYISVCWSYIKDYYLAIGLCFLFSFIGLLIMGLPGALLAYVIDLIQSMFGLKPLSGNQMVSLGVVYTMFAPLLTLLSYTYIRKFYPGLNSFYIFLMAFTVIFISLFSIQLFISLSNLIMASKPTD